MKTMKERNDEFEIKQPEKEAELRPCKVSLEQRFNSVAVCINGVEVAFLSGDNCDLCRALITNDEAATISPVLTEVRGGYRVIKIR